MARKSDNSSALAAGWPIAKGTIKAPAIAAVSATVRPFFITPPNHGLFGSAPTWLGAVGAGPTRRLNSLSFGAVLSFFYFIHLYE
ncbi:MAG TPA: hypothetical protein VFX06_10770 [Stellaceae bacterium]|nr:hypothetical protein [Stellaceae bacterium]